MFPYNYNTARMIHRYKSIGGKTSDMFMEYALPHIDGYEYADVDYRVKLFNYQSINVNSKGFNGTLLVTDRGAGKDYALIGALLEYISHNDNSTIALFSFEVRRDNFRLSSTFNTLKKLCPPKLTFELSGNLIEFSNGSSVELLYCLSSIDKIANAYIPVVYDLVLVNESKFQNEISLDSINKLSNNKWVCVGTYDDPLNDSFVKECLSSNCDVRFAVVQDNTALPSIYISEVERSHGLFSNVKE